MELKELIGKTVVSAFISPYRQVILLNTTDGPFLLRAVGECCSESWFQSCFGIEALLNNTITDVAKINIAAGLPGTRQDSDDLYGLRLTTLEGVCEIDMRNSSNGYYGGYYDLEAGSSEEASIPVNGDFI